MNKDEKRKISKIKVFEKPDIHVTYDYDMFSHLLGNRPVTNKRAAKIANSIMNRGYIPVPIVVNEKLEIIDGQGRTEALKMLDAGLPLYYVIIPGLGIDDCIAMNVTGTKWSTLDYIHGYADTGNQDYKRLLITLENHSLSLSVVNCAITGILATNTKKIIDGDYKYPEHKMADVDEMLAYVERFKPIIKEHNIKNSITIYLAMCFCYQCEQVDNDQMLDRFERYWHLTKNSTDTITVLDGLTEIYNFARRNGKAYITTLYREYMDGKYGWYTKKYDHLYEQQSF